ncbi:uncharacterized protein LOC110701823 [Chenopodium quinoa]|uniref:uncharacterized protein LOC110701823 n=1 Tax=Chenopodium quinoa TaxID=63459 RepID=UPI000B77B19E|nr:uncharacterized protein LOC110701823 [Chenopodium quinoa]
MKRKERSWMYERKVGNSINPEFLKGVDEFLKYVEDHPESSNPNESQDQGHSEEPPVSLEEEPNAQAKPFFDLLRASEQPLYEGSSLSVLEMASRITSLKCEYNLPHRCVDGFASLVNEAIPNNNHMAETFYEVKKIVKGLELPHEKIHACPKGCMLFWKDDAQLSTCRVCGSDRYKKTSKGSLVPLNVLFYFPITPRLQRLFATKNISEEMTWHAKNPRVQGTMAHPSDSEAWKHLDSCFPEFASEPRNVRLGLCTDGFAPHGQFGGQYSCWPVILTPYNLPPSMCMKRQFMFLSLLVPGPKNPKGNLDVYMQPLIHELKQLWEVGENTYDISRKQNINLRAAILWTVSDFPAYGMLSGWTTAGKKSCPYCMEKSKAFWLENCGKVSWFDCHRQFLPTNHPFRNSKNAFCKNKVEKGSPPHIMSGEELWECVKNLPKATDGPEALKRVKNAKKGWFKQSTLWDLPYWKHLLVRHNLDVMHVEKNFFNQLIHTIMDVKKQSCDTPSARNDIAKYCKRPQLHLQEDDRGKEFMPKAPFALDKAQRKVLCEWVKQLRFPDGYASNLSRCVDLQSGKLHGMKIHDCHVFMERLFPTALRELLPTHIWNAITEISQFFRDLCCYTITVSDMERLEKNIAEILCKLEKVFPPSFFNSMEHLPIHLPYEGKLCGPVQYRWMYPFERFLNHLKRKIGNKARVEGSICNAYLTEEISNFCSNYFQPSVDTKTRDLGRNVNADVESPADNDEIPKLFTMDKGRVSNLGKTRYLDDKELERAHLFVLRNTGILGEYERQFEDYILSTRTYLRREDVMEKCESEFPDWFHHKVREQKPSSDVLRALSMRPFKRVRTWNQIFVGGFNFHTQSYGKHKSTMNYGVCVSSEDGEEYFGILNDIIELIYTDPEKEYKTILFSCSWMDCGKGMNIHEQYKLVEVNHTKKYPKYDPFVLSYQVSQVYYASYPSLKRDRVQWWVVFRTQARSVIDAPVDLEFL